MNSENPDQSNAQLPQVRTPIAGIGVALGVFCALVLIYLLVIGPAKPTGRLLLAPMIGQLEPCVSRTALPPEHVIDPAFVACSSDAGSAAAVIDHTLSRLGPRISANGRYELGYTLNVPLLKFLVLREGQWVLDQVAIDRTLKAIAQSDRRLILYLFSTHFSGFAPIEPVLAADPANVAMTQGGPLGMGKHYGMDVYPWTLARTDNSLTRARVQVIQAFVDELCKRQSRAVRNRIEGITLLGETHQLFPDFEAGMGFDGKYLVTDYSQASADNFRLFLKKRYANVSALNQALGGSKFADFNAVEPPSKDIRRDALRHFWEHIDAYAAGSFPVSGWLAPQPNLTGWVQIYVNGEPQARVRAGLGRQDVKDHLPDLKTANVGWRYDLDFHSLAPGIYEVAALAEVSEGLPVMLGKKNISVIDREQSTPQRTASKNLPAHAQPTADKASFDLPTPDSAYFYNPLAALWRDFREQQVVDYLQFVAQPLLDSCLSETPRYVHQLFPYPNPSWDTTKYAVNASLTRTSDLRLGVSLYGEGGYGESFFDWKGKTWGPSQWPVMDRKQIYGITEFHPLRGMDSAELQGVFDRHRDNGAQFLSFFLEGRGPINRPYAVKGSTIPFLGEANTQNGSDQLYRSVKQLMTQP